jgi:hypothetical protein
MEKFWKTFCFLIGLSTHISGVAVSCDYQRGIRDLAKSNTGSNLNNVFVKARL